MEMKKGMKKFCAVSLYVGVFLLAVYMIADCFIGRIPDGIAYPVIIVSAVLMTVGLAYHGWCIGKRRSPFDF